MPNIPREPNDYLVAVSSHSKALEAVQPSDFTWFKCRARHTVSKIRTFYTQKTSCQVDLYSGTAMPADTTQVAWLDHWGDRLIVFRAVENEQQAILNALTPRKPLKPVNGTHSSSKSSSTPEKTLKPTIKPDPDPVSFPSGPILPPTVTGSRDRGGTYLNGSSILQRQSTLNNRLPVGQHISGVVNEPHYSSPYGQFPSQSPVTTRDEDPFGGSSSSATRSVVKQEPQHTIRDFLSIPQAASESVPPAAAPVPNAAQNRRLAKILAGATPEILEGEVQSSISLLDQLEAHLSNLPAQCAEAQQWLQQIDALKNKNINEPTIIGVVGNTGAGKSSVINAMLDEERLVPTNCMRACTAVVTEMSWNSSEDENAKYRAEIEFIQAEDWEKELQVLFAEMLDGNGNISRDVYTEDSEAGVAYAKIRAVYPQKSKEELANSNIANLMREPAVRNVLGTTKSVKQARSDTFYRILQTYVDSKEKATDDKKQKKEMEYWPLIKVVKIFTKADALSTGAVIVDLPGVHDSNAARSAVAQNYMKTCTGTSTHLSSIVETDVWQVYGS